MPLRRVFLKWPISISRHPADLGVPDGPLRDEGTPFGDAHLVALGPEIPRRATPRALPVNIFAAVTPHSTDFKFDFNNKVISRVTIQRI